MSTPEFPRNHVAALEKDASRLLDRRRAGTDFGVLARDLLIGFVDHCTRTGLDKIVDELALAAGDELDLEPRVPALVAEIEKIDLDGGGPSGQKPKQLVACVMTALGATVVDPPNRTIALGDDLRLKVVAAISAPIEAALAVPKIRDTVIAEAKAKLDEHHHIPFNKLAKQLDERGMALLKPPNIPVDAMQAITRILAETRFAIIARAANAGIDKARELIAEVSAEAAERIDQPITHRLTPRDVAIARANHPEVPKQPQFVIPAIVDGLSQGAAIAWRVAEKAVRPYAASQKFAVGELIEHVKFGRGTVATVSDKRIDVEFSDGKVTLVHAK